MCIGLWTLEHPEYALVLCSNRDEFLSRPTEDAHFHSFDAFRASAAEEGNASKYVLSGRDLEAGGSWLGINRAGRVALLTNITEEQKGRYRSSRGGLVANYLVPDAPGWKEYATAAAADPNSDYAGFNLLLLEPRKHVECRSLSYEAALLTNSGGGGRLSVKHASSPECIVHALSNMSEAKGEKEWPKVRKGKELLSAALFADKHDGGKALLDEEELAERLFKILSWQPETPPDNRYSLRTSILIQPIQILESLDPSIKVEGPSIRDYYGTRLSTVILVRRDGSVLFIERDIWLRDADGNAARGDPLRARVYRFRLAEE